MTKKKDYYFQYSQSQNNYFNKYGSDNNLNKDSNRTNFNSELNVILKDYHDYSQNKIIITIISFCIIVYYTQNIYVKFFQIVTCHFSFTQYINKKKVKIYHKIGLVISYKIV